MVDQIGEIIKAIAAVVRAARRDDEALAGNKVFRYEETSSEYVLRDMATGRDLDCDDPAPYRARYQALLDGTAYGDLRAQDESRQERAVLEQRLKDLGYL